MDALLDRRGWWTLGSTGYVGPAPSLPPDPGPRRVALVDVQAQLLGVPPAQLDEEVERTFGPGHLVVIQTLGAVQHQCFAVEETILEQAGSWDDTALAAPYPLAIQAWLASQTRNADEDTHAVIERVGDTLLITVCQAARVLVYRQVDGEPASWTQEIRRTLLGLGAEAGPAVVLAATDVLPLDLEGEQLRLGPGVLAPVRTLPTPAVALRGLARLGPRAGFVSRARARAHVEAREYARQRRRAAVAVGAAALGGVIWLAGLALERGLQGRKQMLAREATGLERTLVELAPRKLGSVLRPAPVRELGEILTAIPPELGLVQAVAEPDQAGTRLTLQFRPSDPALGNAEVLRAVLDALPGLGRVTVEPVLGNTGEVTWQARGHVEGSP